MEFYTSLFRISLVALSAVAGGALAEGKKDKKDEFVKDVNFYRAMMPVVLSQTALSNKITKTMIRCGQEVNNVFREVYTTLQVKAKHDSSYQPYLDKLAPYFKKFGKKKGSGNKPTT